MAFSLEERVDPKQGMLIVVDMQNDFCHRDGAACKRGRDMAFVENMIPRLIKFGEPSPRAQFPHLLCQDFGQSMDQLAGLDGV